MLHNSTKKRLREHNWIEFERDDGNPSQTWRRVRNASINAINDLALIAQKVPEDKQNEIFSYENVQKLLTSMFGSKSDYINKTFSLRQLELASLLVEIGTSVCKSQIQKLNIDTLALAEATINHLDKSVDICKNVSYRIELNRLEEKGLIFLFSWSKLRTRDENRLIRFLSDETDDPTLLYLIHDTSVPGIKRYEVWAYNPNDNENERTGILSIELKPAENKARLSFRYDENGYELVKDLIVKSDYNDYYIYAKKP